MKLTCGVTKINLGRYLYRYFPLNTIRCTTLRVKVTKGCKSFYVYTITQIVYYSMDKYSTKLLKL